MVIGRFSMLWVMAIERFSPPRGHAASAAAADDVLHSPAREAARGSIAALLKGAAGETLCGAKERLWAGV